MSSFMNHPARRLSLIVAAVLFAVVSTAGAQTDYFWQAPNGNSGTWDTASVSWSTTAAGPVNYTWTNNGSERANFGNTAGTVTIQAGGVTAFGLNFLTASYILGPTDATSVLTLSGAGGQITGSAATINVPIAGTVGLTKTGNNSLTLTAASTYTGTTTVTGVAGTGTAAIVATAQATGSPFGAATNPVALTFANLQLNGIASSTTTTVGNFTVGAPSANNTGAATLTINNLAGGAGVTTAFAAGNLARGGAGSTLVLVPVTGALGAGENVSFANAATLQANGIVSPWVATVTSAANTAGDFVTNGASGLTYASAAGAYFAGGLATSTSANAVDQSAAFNAAGPIAAYALRTNSAITLNGNTLSLGNGTGPTGLILNSGASITGGNVTFGPTEGLVYSQGTATLGGAGNTITSNGLTVTGLGLTTLTIGGNIVDGTQPARVIYTMTTSGSGVTLNGANTYTGGTLLDVNNSSTTAAVVVGSDSAFGTGKVTNLLSPNGGSVQMQAANGPRTLANAFDLNGGLTFIGTDALTFAGPITIINTGAGRTLQTNTAVRVTFGATSNSSTITLGNPASNGGDGVGKNLTVVANATGSTITINAVMQAPPGGSGGSVTYSGLTGSTIQVFGQNTYTGGTTFNSGDTVIPRTVLQFNHDYNLGDPSGPFGIVTTPGTGVLLMNSTSNVTLTPVQGNRTIANPITMNFGFTVGNATGDTSGVTFTGPITMLANGRTINNGFAAGAAVLTLGSAASPSTLTMPTATGQTLTITGAGTTVINDTIQDAPGIPTIIAASHTGTLVFNGPQNTNGNLTISGSGATTTFNAPRNGTGIVTISGGVAVPPTVNLNALSTYSGGTNVTQAGTIFEIGVSSNSPFTAGPFGTGPITFNNSGTNQTYQPAGGDRTVANALNMVTGFIVSNTAGTNFNLTFTGPINLTNANRTFSNNLSAGATLTLGSSTAPSTMTAGTTGAFQFIVGGTGAAQTVINDVIQDPAGFPGGSLSLNNTGAGGIVLNAANTYTGATAIGGAGTTVFIGSNQPFGVGGTVTIGNATAPKLQAAGADRSFANNVVVNNLAAVSGAFSITMNGSLTNSGGDRTLTNTIAAGKALNLNNVFLSESTTAGRTLTFAGTGTTVVNGVVADASAAGAPGSLVVSGGTVRLNGANTYTGTTSVVGTGAVGSGGTLGGTGTVPGTITISSTVAANQGGVIAPGNSAGTLTVGSMTLNPFGRYVFEHSGSNPAVGGGVNDLINGTGALDLTNLGNIAPGSPSPTPFDLNLQPLSFGTTAAQQNYVIAVFAGGVTGTVGGVGTQPVPNATDVSNLFTLSGAFISAPGTYMQVVANPLGTGQALQLSFTPVPEPAFILLACGGLTAAAGWRRARSRRTCAA